MKQQFVGVIPHHLDRLNVQGQSNSGMVKKRSVNIWKDSAKAFIEIPDLLHDSPRTPPANLDSLKF